MSLTEMFPSTYVARFRGNKIGDRGLYYSKDLNLLLVGYIDQDSCLAGKVIHDGVLKDSYRMASFRRGYTYKNWDQHEFEYLGHINTFLTLQGYLSFLKTATVEKIEAYFKAKPLIQELYEN